MVQWFGAAHCIREAGVCPRLPLGRGGFNTALGFSIVVEAQALSRTPDKKGQGLRSQVALLSAPAPGLSPLLRLLKLTHFAWADNNSIYSLRGELIELMQESLVYAVLGRL